MKEVTLVAVISDDETTQQTKVFTDPDEASEYAEHLLTDTFSVFSVDLIEEIIDSGYYRGTGGVVLQITQIPLV